MPCDRIQGRGPNGQRVDMWICSRGARGKRCYVTGCTNRATHLCDFALTGRKSGQTCDRAVCEKHAHRVQEIDRIEAGVMTRDTVDYCPTHFALHANGGDQPALGTEAKR